MQNLKQIIESELFERAKLLNAKPFNIFDFFDFANDERQVIREYAQGILCINEFLINTNQNVSAEKFLNDIKIWLDVNSKNSVEKIQLQEVTIELLMICGIYARFNFNQKDELKYGLKLIRDHDFLENLENIRLDKIRKELEEFQTKLVSLSERNNFNELFALQKEYYKKIINLKGQSLVFYHFVNRLCSQLNFTFHIPKTEICYFFAETLFKLKLITFRQFDNNFATNLYRQLSRIDLEVIEILKDIIQRMLPLLNNQQI